MPRPVVGGPGVESKRVMVRMPVWMADALAAEAIRQESDISKLIRLAIRAHFFSPANANSLRRDASDGHGAAV